MRAFPIDCFSFAETIVLAVQQLCRTDFRQPETKPNTTFPDTMTDYTALHQMLAEDDYGDIRETLLFFLEECSLDEAPSAEELRRWQTILSARGGKFTRLAELCGS